MIRDAAHNVNTTVTQLSELQTQLNVSLSELREGLDNLSMSCTAETCDLVPSPDSVNLAVDWSSVCTSTVEMSIVLVLRQYLCSLIPDPDPLLWNTNLTFMINGRRAWE